MVRSWLLLVLPVIACGKVRTVSPSDADGGSDEADSAPAAPGLVTVTVEDMFDDLNAGEPLPDLPVLFFGPDHELIAEEETDEDGVASATVPPGSVVLILAEIEADQFVTIAVFDVQPGDELRFPSPEPPAEPAVELNSMTIDFPDSDDADLSYYRADNGCTSNTSLPESSQIDLPFDASCLEVGTSEFDVVVRALDGEDNVLETAHGHFVYTDFGVATLESWNGTQDLELPVTGIPDELHTVTVRSTPAIGRLQFGSISSDTIEPPGATYDISVGAIDGWGGALDVLVDYRPIQAAFGRQLAFYRLEADATDLPLPLDTELLPWYGPASLSSATRTISWVRTEGGGVPDAQYVYVFGETKSATIAGMLAVVPPGWTSVTVPELPDEYSDHVLDDYGELITIIQAIEVSGYDGYEIRETGILPFLWSLDDFPSDPDVGFHLKTSGVGGGK